VLWLKHEDLNTAMSDMEDMARSLLS
jgi:hypothetical protein